MQYAQPQNALSAKGLKNQLFTWEYKDEAEQIRNDKSVFSELTELSFSKINQLFEIMQRYQVTGEDLTQAFNILSDLLKEKGIYIDSANFSIESNGKEEWIHYEYALSVSAEELSALEAELNIRLSELPSKIFDAIEIDIVSSEPITDTPKDMTEIILANNGLMESIRIAQQEMREGLLIPLIN